MLLLMWGMADSKNIKDVEDVAVRNDSGNGDEHGPSQDFRARLGTRGSLGLPWPSHKNLYNFRGANHQVLTFPLHALKASPSATPRDG